MIRVPSPQRLVHTATKPVYHRVCGHRISNSDAGKLLLYIDGTVDYAVLFSPTTPPVLEEK